MIDAIRKAPWRNLLFLPLLFVLGLAGYALAEVSISAWSQSRGEQGVENGGYNELWDGTVSTVTSSSWASPQLPVYTRGATKVGLALSTTDEDEDIVVVAGLYHYDAANDEYTFLGVSGVATVEADVYETAAGRYVDDDIHEFETHGANVIDVRLVTLPGPDMNIQGGVFGMGPFFYLPDAPAP